MSPQRRTREAAAREILRLRDAVLEDVDAERVPDDPDRVGDRTAVLATDHDVVVTTGGTGVASTDEIGGILRDRAEVRVADVAIRPGSNATLARLPSVTARMTTPLPVPDRDLEFAVPVEFRDDGDRPTAEGSGDSLPPVVPFGHPASSVDLYEGRFRPHRVASCVRLSAADGFVLARSDLAAGDRVGVVPYGAVES